MIKLYSLFKTVFHLVFLTILKTVHVKFCRNANMKNSQVYSVLKNCQQGKLPTRINFSPKKPMSTPEQTTYDRHKYSYIHNYLHTEKYFWSRCLVWRCCLGMVCRKRLQPHPDMCPLGSSHNQSLIHRTWFPWGTFLQQDISQFASKHHFTQITYVPGTNAYQSSLTAMHFCFLCTAQSIIPKGKTINIFISCDFISYLYDETNIIILG